MNKLLNACIRRIFKIKTLYICLAVLIFMDVFDIVKEYLTCESKETLPAPDGYLLSGFMMIVLLAAVFISSFLGSEHAFGTLRNKISVGYSRTEIYVSSFIACYLAVMIMFATVWILTFFLGTLLLGGFQFTANELLIKLLVSFLAVTILTALYVMIGLCIQSKSLGSVTAVIAAFVVLMMGVATTMMLSQPEYISAAAVDTSMGQTYEVSPEDPSLVKNPDYVTGTTRRNFQIADDLGPVSQILNTTDTLEGKDVVIPMCEIVILTIMGLVIFKKRDLK